MKYVITLLFLLFTSSVIADDFLDGLEKKYNQSLLMIVEDCDSDADWNRKAAINREAGVPRKVIMNWIIDDANEQNKTIKVPFTTEDVLWRLSLIIWVYNKHQMTPNEIYKTTNDWCIDESKTYLDMVYNRVKVYYKLQQMQPEVIPIE